MKTRRTVKINKDGETTPNTFNKTAPLNVYKNENARLEYPKGCTNSGCKLCDCTIHLQIKNINWSVWADKTGFDLGRYLGNKYLYTNISRDSNHEIGFIKDVVFPNGDYCLIGCSGNDCSSSFPIDVDLFLHPTQKNCNIPDVSGIYFKDSSQNILDGSANYNFDIILPASIKRAGAPFRAPIAGYRKSLVCCSSNEICGDIIPPHNTKKTPSNTVYGDPSYYKPHPNDISKCVIYDKRIRSGMQPKQRCPKKDCNKKCCEKAYSFSYSEYNKNHTLNTYERGLERNNTSDRNNTPDISYLNGKYSKSAFIKSSSLVCDISCCKSNNITIWKPNNKTFKVQGAVSSSSRVDRIKLDTLRVANSKCGGNTGTPNDSRSRACDENKIGKGKYFAGQPRFDGWMFNKTHPESVCSTRYRQLPFGVPQLTRNVRPTRTNKMIGINLRQKNNGMGIFKRYYTNRAPACNYSCCNDNCIGENMKCPYCYTPGYHYHSGCEGLFKNHGPTMTMETMCKTCVRCKGASHYHNC